MAPIGDSEDTTKVAAKSANGFDDSAEKGREAVGPVVELDAVRRRKLIEDLFKRHTRDLVHWLKRVLAPAPENFAVSGFRTRTRTGAPMRDWQIAGAKLKNA